MIFGGVDWGVALGAGVAAGGLTALALPPLRRWLVARGIFDQPNSRSSHQVPVPLGGGLAVVGAVLVVWCAVLALSTGTEPMVWAVVAGGAALLVVSWVDDCRSLPWSLRLVVQAASVAVALALWPDDWLVCQGAVPVWLDRLIAAVLWLWFTNLYNFMDGLDGITGVETASLGLGLAIVVPVALGGATLGLPVVALGMAAAGGGLALLGWNWHPAKIFPGDAGSIPLGYLLGFLLLALAASGAWAAAVILPAYYLADATLTLGRRLSEGKSILGHRDHFYQRAVHGRGLDHRQVVSRIAVGNATLIVAALDAETIQLGTGLAAAGFVLMVLIGSFNRPAGSEHP